MTGIEHLIHRYFEQKRELELAYIARPWHSGRIDRLADQLTHTEQQIVAERAAAQLRSDVLASAR
jgi:hypothetical protein